MACRRNSAPIVRNSIATFRRGLFLARTDRARKPRRPSSKIGGARAGWEVPRRIMTDCSLFADRYFTEDLKKITVPVLVMHSEDDQIVPYVAAGPLSAKLLKNGTLKTYKDFPHGMPTTQAETINSDLLAFLKG